MKKILDLKKIFLTFKELNNDEKGLLFLRSIRDFESLVKGTFVNIYIFSLQQNIYQVLWINIIGYFFTSVGYWLFGIVLTKYSLNVKRVLQSSFVVSILSFLILIFFGGSIGGVVIFTIVNGISRGLYFSSLIYLESHNIKDVKADFYGSMFYVIKKSIGIASPLVITLLFLVPKYFDISGYSLIFTATILVNLFTIYYVNRFSTHRLKKINLKNLNLKGFKIKEILHYMSFGMYNCGDIIIALVLVYVLKSELNIGVYETILAILSIFLVLKNSIHTHKGNRKKYYTIFGLILAINIIFFGFNLTLIGLTVYTIINILFGPIFDSLRFGYYYHFLEDKDEEHKEQKFVRVVNADFWTQFGRVVLMSITLISVWIAPVEMALIVAMMIFSLSIIFAVMVIHKYG